MKHSKALLSGLAVLAALTLGAPRAHAQEDEAKPKPAAKAPPLMGMGQDDAEQTPANELQPDNRPLTGMQTPTLGTPQFRHSYWVPGLQYGNTTQNYALNQTSSADWTVNSYVAGNLSLLEAWSHSQLSMNYSGGGLFSTNSAQDNSYFHQLGLVQAFQRRRWQVQFLDQFSYLPEAQFGFGGAANLNTPGIGGSLGGSLPGLQGTYVPNQSILTSVGSRYSNAFATQVSYALSRRGSLTVAGSYGILRFVEAGNIESDTVSGTVGYDYALTSEDQLGGQYRFSAYHFAGFPQAFADHTLQIVYGRKITGRLALQLAGGPELSTFRIPIGNSSSRLSASGRASLSYGFKRGSISLGYDHSVSNGGGVLIGSSTDSVSMDANRQISRQWQMQGNFGYARNHALVNANAQGYDTWFAGGGLSRPLGRNASLSFGYTARIQASQLPVCAAGNCSTSFTQHQISLGFQWHTRPFVIR